MADYLIHTCKQREWYVENYLVPSMVAQGIDREHINVYMDSGLGNLGAFLDSLTTVTHSKILDKGTWHLQDDIIISSDFKRVTEENNTGVVAGFGSVFDKSPAYWYSFQCIRIPNVIAYDFLRWIDTAARENYEYRAWIALNKCDDSLFQAYCREKAIPMKLLIPNIVDHIDYLIGGSIANKCRQQPQTRSTYWTEEPLVKQLEQDLHTHRRI